jgi:hypothetical protein
MAAQAPFEIIAGPARVYLAPTGTAFPAVNAAPAGAWVDMGMTEGGVTVRHTQNVELITTDQYTAPVKGIRTEEGVEVEFALAELTLERYKWALNNVTVTSLAGPPATKEIVLYRGVEVSRHACLVRGPSPYLDAFMQYQIPVVIQTDEPEVAFVKDDKSVLQCTFTSLIDLTAATESERFGKLVAQSA